MFYLRLMKNYIILLLSLFTSLSIFAQKPYYWYKGKKVSLDYDSTAVYIISKKVLKSPKSILQDSTMKDSVKITYSNTVKYNKEIYWTTFRSTKKFKTRTHSDVLYQTFG